jgi:hypothetical protein
MAEKETPQGFLFYGLIRTIKCPTKGVTGVGEDLKIRHGLLFGNICRVAMAKSYPVFGDKEQKAFLCVLKYGRNVLEKKSRH